MKAINVWNESSEEVREKICKLAGWPDQYAEGEASEEWLTKAQLKKLGKLEVDVGWDGEEFVLLP